MAPRSPRFPGAEHDPARRTPDADYAAALGRAIKVFRTGLGMGRRQLAAAAGLSYSYVTEIENGKKQASAAAQKAIAAALGLSVSRLLAAAEEWSGQRSFLAVDSLGFESMPADSLPYASGLSPDDVDSILERLRGLLLQMEPGDRERVVDLARRLAQR